MRPPPGPGREARLRQRHRRRLVVDGDADPGGRLTAFDWQKCVAAGYDAIAQRFADEATIDHVLPWLERLTAPLPDGARVLDLGCGSGAAGRWLNARFDVIGADISRGQLSIAAKKSRSAQLIYADMASLHFRHSQFAAVVVLYSLIHVKRRLHAPIIDRIRDWLVPGGHCLLVLGGGDTPIGYEDDWFGAPMLWSHYDAAASLALVKDAGFLVEHSDVVHDPIADDADGEHLFVIAEKPGTL